MDGRAKVVLFANTDWYLFNFRLALAKRLRSEGMELLMLSPPGQFGDSLRAAGFRWEPVHMERRSLNPVRELGLIAGLTNRFRRERPDLVHGLTLKCAIYGSIAARLAGVPTRLGEAAGMGYVFTNDSASALILRPLVRWLMRLGLGGSGSLLILQNPDDVVRIREAGVLDEARIRLIRSSGVDSRDFSPAVDGGIPTRPFRVLFAGRLLWDKGVGEYVEAARRLRADGRDVTFLIAGRPDPGNPGSVPDDILEEWAQEGLVEPLGQVDDMPDLLRKVHALILPSYYGEGVPRSLIEGAACGLPLVTTDMPGCREVVTHEREGLLVPPRNGRALAEAIARLDDDPTLADRLGRTGRAKVLREFDEQIVLDRTLDVYRELLPGVGGAPKVGADHPP